MAITKIQAGALPADVITTAAIDDASITHAKLHTTMDLSSKTVTLPSLSQTIVNSSHIQMGGNLDVVGQIGAYDNPGSSWGKMILRATDFELKNAGGTIKMVLDTSGNVGIGTSAPAGRFHVVGPGGLTGGTPQNSGSKNQIVIENNASSGSADIQMLGPTNGYNHIFFGDADDANIGVIWYNHNNNSLNFNTNANNGSMILNSSGNVGIGETSPVGKLSIKGTTASNENSHVTFENTQGSKVFAIGGGKSGITNNGFSIVNITDNNAPLHIDNSGNVGIGTTDPEDKLHIRGINEPAHIRLQRHESDEALDNGDEIGGIEFWANDGTYNSNASTLRAAIRAETQNTSSGTRLEFWTGNSTSAVEERMRIIADGKVGIGTTSPSATLHVEDTVTGGGNSGHMKLGHTRTRTFYAGISSSENRWYKVLNYGTGNMFTGKVQIYLTREGGFNQTGAHKEYRASLGGYSNSVYGPLSLSGDGGEGGVASLEIGTDAGVYLRVNSSIYGGSVFVIFSGQGGIGWAYSNSSYSTSLP